MLLDSSAEHVGTEKCKILLTIDLTQSVADEAVAQSANMVVAYHPFIFKGLKLITSADPQQRSLIKLLQNHISVYSPHTAVDSAKGGVNDFLADGISQSGPVQSREVIEPHATEAGCGMGRLVTFAEPVPLSQLVADVKKNLGLTHVQVGLGRNQDKDQGISTVAICAGSGGSVFRGTKADLYYTGELSHHEALYFTEVGSSVLACNHSNTERAFLHVLRDQLLGELPDAEIVVSEADKDPYQTW